MAVPLEQNAMLTKVIKNIHGLAKNGWDVNSTQMQPIKALGRLLSFTISLII